VVVFGEAAWKIEQEIAALKGSGRSPTIRRCDDLEQAVSAAAEIVEPGDVVLFSPGGTSFDAFQDFADRGEQYTLWVNTLQ
jgi:UDP-N-acetylmuramoylalanine--D-glutamate ligase